MPDAAEARDEARPVLDRAATGGRPRAAADPTTTDERPGPSDTQPQRVVARASTPGETPSVARASSGDDSASESRAKPTSRWPATKLDPTPRRSERPSAHHRPVRRRPSRARAHARGNERARDASTPVAADEAQPNETASTSCARRSDRRGDQSSAPVRRAPQRSERRRAHQRPVRRLPPPARQHEPATRCPRGGRRCSTGRRSVRPTQRVVARASTTSEPPAAAPADPTPSSPSRAVAREPDRSTPGRASAPVRPRKLVRRGERSARASDGPDTAPALPESTPSRGALMRLRTAPTVRDEPGATPSGSDVPSSDRPRPGAAAVPAPEGATPPRRRGPAVARTPAGGDVAQPGAAGERRDPAPLTLRAEHSEEGPAIARKSAPVEPAHEPTQSPRRASADTPPAATRAPQPARPAAASPMIARTSAPVEPVGEATQSAHRASADVPSAATRAPQPVRPAGESPAIARTSLPSESARLRGRACPAGWPLHQRARCPTRRPMHRSSLSSCAIRPGPPASGHPRPASRPPNRCCRCAKRQLSRGRLLPSRRGRSAERPPTHRTPCHRLQSTVPSLCLGATAHRRRPSRWRRLRTRRSPARGARPPSCAPCAGRVRLNPSRRNRRRRP